LTDQFDLLPIIGGERTAGDIRAIEHPILASIHTIWLREHNRIADWVCATNPSCDDECAYQTTRRLVIAEMQNIIFGEWLPIIIGDTLMRESGLHTPPVQEDLYDSTLDPSIVNSFGAAAFRFGHTLLQGTTCMISNTGEVSTYELKDNFNNPAIYEQNEGEAMEEILKGTTVQPSQAFDRFVIDDVTNFLFLGSEEGAVGSRGSDLIARNIQRGRDHGIPGYVEFRRLFGLSDIPSFDVRPKEISPSRWALLQSVYSDPSQIDLFTAGLLETVEEGVVGPTFGLIITNQFKRLKFADRFFFTHSGQAGSLSAAEFKWARSRTMRDILCDNTNIERLQTNVFLDNNSVRWSCERVRNLPFPKLPHHSRRHGPPHHPRL